MAMHNPLIHGRWMTAEKWCSLIKKYYISNKIMEFNGSILAKCLGLKRYQGLKMQMEALHNITISNDHIGVFSNKHRPKNQPMCH
jgi:hypothetical protein